MRATRDLIGQIVMRALTPRLSEAGISSIEADTNLAKLGLVDSAALLDIIVQVESEAGVEFNPVGLDLEEGLTMHALVSAFVADTDATVALASVANSRR